MAPQATATAPVAPPRATPPCHLGSRPPRLDPQPPLGHRSPPGHPVPPRLPSPRPGPQTRLGPQPKAAVSSPLCGLWQNSSFPVTSPGSGFRQLNHKHIVVIIFNHLNLRSRLEPELPQCGKHQVLAAPRKKNSFCSKMLFSCPTFFKRVFKLQAV